MNKFILIIFLVYGIQNICFSQEVQFRRCLTGCVESDADDPNNEIATYGALDTFETNETASDFGPRLFGGDRYDWHGGVDYSSGGGDRDRGDLLIAIEGGTIIWNMNLGYKWIIINSDDGRDYGYGHLFRTSNDYPLKSGNCILKYQLGVNSNRLALIVPIFNNDNSISGYRAISNVGGGQVIHGADTLDVVNTVAAGDVIGPMGSSIAVGRTVPVHLHLYSFANNMFSLNDANTKDPLEFIQHEVPDYEVEILNPLNNNPWTTLDYRQGQSTKFLVRPMMNNERSGVSIYQNGIMNIDDVELLIKKETEADFSRIQGNNRHSIISHGARINTNKNPQHITRDGSGSNGGGTAQIGSINRTGIEPFAYADAASHPYDNYFFTDFLQRIHIDDDLNEDSPTLSNCPQDARYNDGEYQLKARVTDVRGTETESTPIDFIIDNFQPFIQSVSAEIADKIFYEKSWNCMECEGEPGGIHFGGEDRETNVTYQELLRGMDIRVVTSEPVKNLRLSISEPELEIENLEPLEVPDDGMNWVFSIPFFNLIVNTATISFQFTGTDLSDNPLLSLKNFREENCVPIPIRTSNETWSITNYPTGTDETFSFNVGCGVGGGRNSGTTLIISSDDCLSINATTTNVSETGNTDGAINLAVEGGVAPYQYMWDSGATTETLENLGEGQYCVTITDSSCCEEEACFTVANGCMTFKVVTKDK